MLKLRGFSIQTRELTETLRDKLAFSSAAPWVADVGARGQSLIFYYAADASQAQANAEKWGLTAGTNRMPPDFAAQMRDVLPAYCVPSFLVQMDALPLHPVSGKVNMCALPVVTDATDVESAAEDVVIAAAAAAMANVQWPCQLAQPKNCKDTKGPSVGSPKSGTFGFDDARTGPSR